MIRDYLQPASELEIIGEITRLRAAARRLVIACRHQIEIVAAALLRHGSLTGDEIAELLDRERVLPQW
jgi:hypothetical protein